jgi:endonuclease/exonuclease/phosphatase family metal-dependent hydrolase
MRTWIAIKTVPLILFLLLVSGLPVIKKQTRASAQPVQDLTSLMLRNIPQNLESFSIKAMSFNIRYAHFREYRVIDNWLHRKEIVLAAIKKNTPDIIGLQECTLPQLEYLENNLAGYNWTNHKNSIEDYPKKSSTSILYRTSRFKQDVTEYGTFWCSTTPDIAGSMSWGNTEPRMVTWARFIDKQTGKGFYVYNLHFEWASMLSRKQSADLLLRRIHRRRHKTEAVLILGDFNDLPDGEAIARLTNKTVPGSKTFIDTYKSMNGSTRQSGTYHRFKGYRTGKRIDYIMADNKWKILDSYVIYENYNGRYPSDHFPLVTHMTLFH